MAVTLTSAAGGKLPGESYSGPLEGWLVVNGYATKHSDNADHSKDTDVEAKDDPTLAENREGPDETPPGVDDSPLSNDAELHPNQGSGGAVGKLGDEARTYPGGVERDEKTFDNPPFDTDTGQSTSTTNEKAKEPEKAADPVQQQDTDEGVFDERGLSTPTTGS